MIVCTGTFSARKNTMIVLRSGSSRCNRIKLISTRLQRSGSAHSRHGRNRDTSICRPANTLRYSSGHDVEKEILLRRFPGVVIIVAIIILLCVITKTKQ